MQMEVKLVYRLLLSTEQALSERRLCHEDHVDPREPLRDEGPFGDHTGYYTLPEPFPVFHVTAT